MKKFIKGVRFAPKNYSYEVEVKIQHYKKEGYKLPSRHLLRTEEQLAGIRESAKINTALLDYISANIREGMSTAEIDHMLYEFTTDHDAIPCRRPSSSAAPSAPTCSGATRMPPTPTSGLRWKRHRLRSS